LQQPLDASDDEGRPDPVARDGEQRKQRHGLHQVGRHDGAPQVPAVDERTAVGPEDDADGELDDDDGRREAARFRLDVDERRQRHREQPVADVVHEPAAEDQPEVSVPPNAGRHRASLLASYIWRGLGSRRGRGRVWLSSRVRP